MFPTEEMFELIMTCFQLVFNDIKLALKSKPYLFFITIEKGYRDKVDVNKHLFECSTNVMIYEDHTNLGEEVSEIWNSET